MGVQEFKEKIVNDKAFAEKFKDVTTPEQLVEVATKEGFNFTVEDVKNATGLDDLELQSGFVKATIFAKTYFVVTK